MIISTLLPAVAILAALYFFLIRFIPWPFLSYAVVMIAGGLCFAAHTVHFRYIGIDVTAIGLFLVWCHYRWWRQPKDNNATTLPR